MQNTNTYKLMMLIITISQLRIQRYKKQQFKSYLVFDQFIREIMFTDMCVRYLSIYVICSLISQKNDTHLHKRNKLSVHNDLKRVYLHCYIVSKG